VNSSPANRSADRLGVTFLFSLIAHAVLVLGITFSIAESAPSLPALDVILVQSASGEAPEKADFLAQANNSGGGESDKAKRPTDPLSSPIPKPIPGITPRPTETGAPRPTQPTQTELLTTRSAERRVETASETPDRPDLRAPTEREIIERKLEMARLAQEIQRETEQYAKRPKRKYISANTKEYEYASYMAAWVARIERIGNLNYPDEARRQDLHGQLVLTVGLNRDGSVKSVDIIQPSGHKVLDDAAIRIVNLATPFNPLPRKGEVVDELYITRTWQFLEGNILRNR
jgi:protein TonB